MSDWPKEDTHHCSGPSSAWASTLSITSSTVENFSRAQCCSPEVVLSLSPSHLGGSGLMKRCRDMSLKGLELDTVGKVISLTEVSITPSASTRCRMADKPSRLHRRPPQSLPLLNCILALAWATVCQVLSTLEVMPCTTFRALVRQAKYVCDFFQHFKDNG